jgi:hypothetical protein
MINFPSGRLDAPGDGGGVRDRESRVTPLLQLRDSLF